MNASDVQAADEAFADAMEARATAVLALEGDAPRPDIPRCGLVTLDAETYFADPCPEPSLTQSVATTLVTRSARHAWQQHPRLGGGRRHRRSAAMARGTMVHAMMLGGVDITEIGAPDYRKKWAKEAKAAAVAAGKVPMLSHEKAQLEEAVRAIEGRLRQEHGIDLRACGQREVAAFWQSKTDDGERVQCRGQLDHVDVTDRSVVITDLKTADNAKPEKFERSVDTYGYDIQLAAYSEAMACIHPEHARRITYQWVVVETEPPYEVVVPEPSPELVEVGRSRWRRAVNAWARCRRENRWPGYVSGRVVINALPWVATRELGEA